MALAHDFSNWPHSLFDFALDQFQWKGFVVYEAASGLLAESIDANELRVEALKQDKYAFWAWWLRFGVGVECLVKAVFLRHEISLISKNDISRKAPNRSNALVTLSAANVYREVANTRLLAPNNAWLESEFQRLGISHPREINSGTIGRYRNNIFELTNKQIVTQSEQQQIEDSLEVMSDIRRNVDAHVFLKSQVGGSINKDLTAVYLPACNILIRAFQ